MITRFNKCVSVEFIILCLVILTLSSCDDNSRNYKHHGNVERVVVEQPAADTSRVIVEPEAPKAMLKPSTPAPNTTPSAANYDETDNPRGCDPILEDDTVDNGMRRYMKNDAKKGVTSSTSVKAKAILL